MGNLYLLAQFNRVSEVRPFDEVFNGRFNFLIGIFHCHRMGVGVCADWQHLPCFIECQDPVEVVLDDTKLLVALSQFVSQVRHHLDRIGLHAFELSSAYESRIVLLTDVPEFIQFAEEHPQLFSFVVWMSNLYALGAHHTFLCTCILVRRIQYPEVSVNGAYSSII